MSLKNLNRSEIERLRRENLAKRFGVHRAGGDGGRRLNDVEPSAVS